MTTTRMHYHETGSQCYFCKKMLDMFNTCRSHYLLFPALWELFGLAYSLAPARFHASIMLWKLLSVLWMSRAHHEGSPPARRLCCFVAAPSVSQWCLGLRWHTLPLLLAFASARKSLSILIAAIVWVIKLVSVPCLATETVGTRKCGDLLW